MSEFTDTLEKEAKEFAKDWKIPSHVSIMAFSMGAILALKKDIEERMTNAEDKIKILGK